MVKDRFEFLTLRHFFSCLLTKLVCLLLERVAAYNLSPLRRRVGRRAMCGVGRGETCLEGRGERGWWCREERESVLEWVSLLKIVALKKGRSATLRGKPIHSHG